MADYKFTPEERQLFADYYYLCQKFWIVRETDEYWEQLCDAVDKFCKKYNDKFVTEIAVNFVERQERERKHEK